MHWSPNFLAVVFKQQEISLQVLFDNFHLLFGFNNQRRNHGRKVEKFGTDLALYMLYLIGYISDIYTRPREPTNERSSHQNAGFSIQVFKNFPGVIPRTLTAGESDTLPHSPPARPLAGRGTQAHRCWSPNLGSPYCTIT